MAVMTDAQILDWSDGFALRQKPAKFRDIDDVVRWIPLHLGAIDFANQPLYRQFKHIVLIIDEIRKFLPCRYDSGEGVERISGLRMTMEGLVVRVTAVRRAGSELFEDAALVAA